jgi:LPS-assembly protein
MPRTVLLSSGASSSSTHVPAPFPVSCSRGSAPLRRRLPRLTSLAGAVLATLAALPGAAQAQTQTQSQVAQDNGPPRLRLERALGAGRAPGSTARDVPTFARALSIDGEIDERIVFDGLAEVRSGGSVLRADRIIFTQSSDTLQARGNVRLFRDGTLFTGPEFDWQIDAQTGRMPQAEFSYAARQAHGSAGLVELLEPGRARLTDARYTSCTRDDMAWWVQAEKLEIDNTDEVGIARNGRLVFKDVPIFASPYFEFPLGDARRSGVLTPSFGVNSRLGVEATVPIYWNIAPDHDATIAPRAMSKRGVLLQNEFRYLEPTWRGRMQYNILPNDRTTGEQRDLTSLQHEWAGRGGLAAGWNYNRVSDDLYFADFGSNIVVASQSILPQEGYASYTQTYYNTALRVTKNQTLQDPAAPVIKPYERIPQITFNALNTDWRGFDLRLNAEAVRFEHPRLENGDRYIINPSVSYPWLAPGWFIVPRVQLHATRYELEPDSRSAKDERQRTLPIASLDAGLVFEREGRWLGEDVTQTLEPRLYYAYVPFRDQNTLPNFDSALADFNFAQLFSENVYVGGDRIAEANQWTAALVSRWLDPVSGAERLRAAIGQRFYNSPQRVTLPLSGERTEQSSDVLFALSGRLSRNWMTDVALQHSNTLNQLVRTTLNVRYQPRAASVINFAYRYKLNDLEQYDITAQWPITNRWYGVGRANYSARDRDWVEVLGGFEYKADCWVARFAVQRFTTTATTATTQVFFALELNGLGSVGTGPVDQLRRNIPGYQVINPPPAQPGRFEVYE